MREEQNRRTAEQMDNLSGIPTIRLAIGFCAAGLLGALFLTPALDNAAQRVASLSYGDQPNQIDQTVTGSVNKATRKDSVRRYTIRRSVMQKDPAEPCYLFEDGTREGDC